MTTQASITDAEYITDVLNVPSRPNAEDAETAPIDQSQTGDRKRSFAKSKTALLERLTSEFDLLIYCELSVLYYMDCSIIQFAVRAIVQFLFLTPKPTKFPEPPKNPPYIGAIIISNIICILLHFFSANPTTGEASRGYLHGGLFIDFIGQEGPVSKIHLLAVDILILCLQILMVGTLLEKEKIAKLASPRDVRSTSPSAVREEQDHDSEEQGLLRSSQRPPCLESELVDELREENEDSSLAGMRGSLPLYDLHPRDYFYSGEALAMNLDVGRALLTQWHRRASATFVPPSTSLGRGEYSSGLFFRRRLGTHAEPAVS